MEQKNQTDTETETQRGRDERWRRQKERQEEMFNSMPAPEWEMRVGSGCDSRMCSPEGRPATATVTLSFPYLCICFPVCEIQNNLLRRNNKSFQG